MSSTGNPELPQIKRDVLAAVFKPVPEEREAYNEHNVNMWRTLWSPGFLFDEKRYSRCYIQSYSAS